MTTTDRFIDAVEALLSGNFFTSATDIRKFLTTVAEDAELREVLQTSVDAFRSEEDYKKVFFDRGALPDRPDKTVALVTAFLFRVDANRISLSDELSRLFPSLDSVSAYGAFCEKYLQPYAESFVTLLRGEATDAVEQSKPAYDKMNEDLTAILDEAEREIKLSALAELDLTELLDAVRGLKYALAYDDAILTAFGYRRIAYLTERYGVPFPFYPALRDLLKLYGVL
ncbi:MAG: hypothetical protein IJ735_00770 [Clostridia bacterium]|nr:hypothetical protein [Clostridia bacterium]